MPKLLLAIQEAPAFPVPYRWLASCYAYMGRLDEARDVVRRLRAISPVVVPPATQFRNPEQRELLLSACAWRRARLSDVPQRLTLGLRACRARSRNLALI